MNSNKIKAGIRIYFCRNSAHVGTMPAALKKLGLMEDVILEPMPCSGKIDPRYILKTFEGGAKAVCVLACPTGQCKMMEGNLRARRRTRVARELLAEAGLNPDTVQIYLPDSPEQDKLDSAVEIIAQAAGIAGGVHEVLV